MVWTPPKEAVPYFQMLAIALTLLLAQTCPGYGSGADGPLNVGSGAVQVNQAFALAVTATAGQSQVTLQPGAALAKLGPGTLVFLHQTQATTENGLGVQGPFGITGLGVGRYVFARVTGVTGETLTLDAPLEQTFAAPGAQLITVPQHSTITVGGAATLTAPAWNGSSGGLLVLAASSDVQLDGVLDGRGAGFRGGLENYGKFFADGGCDPGSMGGESFNAGPTQRSIQNVWTAGGGAECSDYGGGGGANVGEGGRGGKAAFADVFENTHGGSAVTRTNAQLLFGGGGGGAFGDLVNQVATAGGRGGGVVFVRARALRGSGRIIVDGQTALASSSNGAGGGGAAGTIVLELSTSLSCGLLSARGGGGGNANISHGVGGGGAGGRIQLRVADLNSCPQDIFSGVAGVWPDGKRLFGGPTSATDPRSIGDVVVETGIGAGSCLGFLGEPQLTVSTPVSNGLMVGPAFCFAGTANAPRVSGSVDGQPLGPIDVLATKQWRLCLNGELPSGEHTLVVQAFEASGAVLAEKSVSFRSRSQPLVAGCGCGSTDLAGLAAFLAVALTLFGRPRTSATPSGANTARKREAGGIPARSRHCDRAAS